MEAVKYIHNTIKILDDYPVYYVQASTDIQAPYIVVNLVNELPYYTKGDSDEPAMSRVQVSVYGSTLLEVDTVSKYLINLLDNTFPGSGGIHQVDYRDRTSPFRASPVLDHYVSALEFEVLHDLNSPGLVTTLETLRDWNGNVYGQILVTKLIT